MHFIREIIFYNSRFSGNGDWYVVLAGNYSSWCFISLCYGKKLMLFTYNALPHFKEFYILTHEVLFMNWCVS
jgi:hypothetical protein